jgi:hypothetical protein
VTHDDDRLLDELAAALRAPDTDPSPSEVADVLLAVQAQPNRTVAGPGAWVRDHVSKPLVALIVGVGVLSGGTALALSSDATLPRPLRSVAHAVGLPVDSVALAHTRQTMSDLRSALDDGDEAAVASDAARLRAELTELSGEDRGEVAAEASELLSEADAFLVASQVEDPDGRATGGDDGAGEDDDGGRSGHDDGSSVSSGDDGSSGSGDSGTSGSSGSGGGDDSPDTGSSGSGGGDDVGGGGGSTGGSSSSGSGSDGSATDAGSDTGSGSGDGVSGPSGGSGTDDGTSGSGSGSSGSGGGSGSGSGGGGD